MYYPYQVIKSKMIKYLLFVSLAIITLASCKKEENNSPAYHLSAKIDGVKKDFSRITVAQKFGNSQSGYMIRITGFGGTDSLPTLNLFLDDAEPITAKTYPIEANERVSGMYVSTPQTFFDSDTDFSIIITSITNTEIQGTFKGTMKDGITTLNLTEGSFLAKFY